MASFIYPYWHASGKTNSCTKVLLKNVLPVITGDTLVPLSKQTPFVS